MNTPTKINVALILPDNVIEEVCKLSQQLNNEYETEFVLDNKSFVPHISLYWTEYPYNAFKDVSAELEEVLQKHQPFQLDFSKVTEKMGYIFLEMTKNNSVFDLHKDVILNLNKLRKDYLPEKYKTQNLGKFSQSQQENIKMYGYPHAMEDYHPHITLTKLKSINKNPDLNKIKSQNKSFKLKNVGVFEMGQWGTCKKLANSFQLSAIR